jgi:hypothetical protein
VVQTVASSQPLLLVHSGANYWWGSGVAGNGITTPNDVNNQLITDFSIESKVNHFSIIGTQCYIGKYRVSGSLSGFIFRLNTNNLQLLISQGGTDFVYSSTVGINYIVGQDVWIRCSRNSSSGDIKFFTSLDGTTYSQLGVTVTGVTGAINNPNTLLEIGCINNLASQNISGVVYNTRIFKNDTFTTPTQIFNPNQYNAANSQTQWTSSTGEVWSLNVGTATTGYKGVLVDRTIVQGDGIDDGLLFNLDLSSTNKISVFSVIKKFNSALSLIYDIGILSNRQSLLASASIFDNFNISGVLNRYTTPNNINLLVYTATTDRSLTAIDEQQIYYNNILQNKTQIDGGDTTSNFSNGAASLFMRTDAVANSNSIINSFVIQNNISNTTQRLEMFNVLKTINKL